jgi:hypothetical protein
MEAQKFPVRHYTTGGDMIRPYDITSWSLPLHKGVESVEINTRFMIPEREMAPVEIPFKIIEGRPYAYQGVLFSATNNESYKAAFMAAGMGLKVGTSDRRK